VTAEVGATDRRSEPFGWALALLTALAALLGPIALAMLLRMALVETFEAEGPSMEPTIVGTERFAVNKAAYGLLLPFGTQQVASWSMPGLGEVVVLVSPADDTNVIKRVVGLPGDVIETRGFSVLRNQHELAHELTACPARLSSGGPKRKCYRERLGSRSYLVAYDRSHVESPPLRVPADHVYVLGDNRTLSVDSRNPAFGPVPRSRIAGPATRIYWSKFPGRTLKAVE